MKLYDLDVSGNCYKVRLFAALTGIPLDLVPVDFSKDEQHSSLFTDLNPFQEMRFSSMARRSSGFSGHSRLSGLQSVRPAMVAR